MPSNYSKSAYGGYIGRGKASVSSLQGLRSVLRNDAAERDCAPDAPIAAAAAAPTRAAAPAPAAAHPADDKQTLRGLNDRLSGYLGRVRHLEGENTDLEKQIDEIVSKRKSPEARKWDEVEKPLEELKKKIKGITMDNAKLLLQIDNSNLANGDFKRRLAEERKARGLLEKDLEDLRRTGHDSKLSSKQTLEEIDLVKEELERLKHEHGDEVEVLRDRIRNSAVSVEMDSPGSDLAETLNRIRDQYEKLAKKSQTDADDWYQKKFENIQVAEAQNTEALNSGKMEIKDLGRQRQLLEINIQTMHKMINNLEEELANTQMENARRLGPLHQIIRELEVKLREARSTLERQADVNHDLAGVKMKLEAEIQNYQRLIHGSVPDEDGVAFALDDALHSGSRQQNFKVPQHREVLEEAPVTQESTLANAPPPETPRGGLLGGEEQSDPAEEGKPKTKNKPKIGVEISIA
ncbi:keratin, type I cytoskeletal 18-like [Brachionichthys hirsutus]|uniref:keratin, type I cytoskeletal 18-like n=1 Tax=Brachionichthys hirsutus TaxID=412623 RepID=UPI0036049B33